MAEETINCVATVNDVPSYATETPVAKEPEEVRMDVARAGSKAPDFAGMAYVDGGFKKVQLSDYAGEWMMVCFYPGDFTFV